MGMNLFMVFLLQLDSDLTQQRGRIKIFIFARIEIFQCPFHDRHPSRRVTSDITLKMMVPAAVSTIQGVTIHSKQPSIRCASHMELTSILVCNVSINVKYLRHCPITD